MKMMGYNIRAAIALAVMCQAASALDFSWDDAVDGEIVIPSGVTATVTDEDAAKVAALTKITGADTTARLVFNTTTAIVVNAAIQLSGGSSTVPALDFASTAHVRFKGDLEGRSNGNNYFNLGNMTVEAK